MKMVKKANEHRSFDFYKLALVRLQKLHRSPDGIVRFPDAFLEVCRSFQISKQECWRLFFALRNTGMIEIVTCHGIKIKKACRVGM